MKIRLIGSFALILSLALLGYAVWLARRTEARRAADFPVTVEDSGSPAVDALVRQLVSARPAPHRNGYSGMSGREDSPFPYVTAPVSNALARLKAMGPPVFPALVRHLGDDRYSFSRISTAWDNITVGDAVVEVMSDGHDCIFYKVRKTPSGSGGGPFSFRDYLTAQRAEKWAEWVKAKPRLDIQLDFIDWCVRKEIECGFTDEAQRKNILGDYEKARMRVRTEYSKPGAQSVKGGLAEPHAAQRNW